MRPHHPRRAARRATSALLALVAASGYSSARAQNPPKPKAPAKEASAASKGTQNAPTKGGLFGEWFAAGSGCRASHTSAGDVSFVPTGLAADGKSVRGRFTLGSYKLVSPPAEERTSIAFARECNIRVKVTPPAGKRARGVSARTTWLFSKDAPVRLQLQNTLYMDTSLVGAVFDEIAAGEKISGREKEVVLQPGRWVNVPEQPPRGKAYECGQPIVFGSDFTVIAHRAQKSDAADIRLAGEPKGLEFAVELEDCGPQ